MSTPANQSTAARSSSSISAYLAAEDISYVQPLREFLERYSCRVQTHPPIAEDSQYLICAGQSDFVKHFFERHKSISAKKLAIIYGDCSDDPYSLTAFGVKVIVTDPVVPTAEVTQRFFAFFFTGRGDRMDDRKGLNSSLAPHGRKKESLREESHNQSQQLETDRARVHSTILSIFGSDKPRSKKYRLKLRRFAFATIGVPMFGYFVVSLGYVISLVVACILLVTSASSLLSGNVRVGSSMVQYGKTAVETSQSLSRVVLFPFSIVGAGGVSEDASRLLSLLSDAYDAESGSLSIYSLTTTIGTGILFPGVSTQPVDYADVSQLASEVTHMSSYLALIQAQANALFSSPRFPYTIPIVSTAGSHVVSRIGDARRLIQMVERLLTVYPRMGGFKKKQTYLVLLQNSMELRPTGGFIGSVLLVTFADGKVDDLHVLDVYDADGQLKGHVDPPQPIRELMGQEHWYLRDSNWNPDFSESGRQAQWFYEKEMEQPLDGVIAVSLPLVTSLLKTLGPVEVPDFNERISDSNFYAKSLLYTQTDFFPGSKQKKDFLGALMTAVTLRLSSASQTLAASVLRGVADSFDGRDIQLYSADPTLQNLFAQWGWTGGMAIDPCKPVPYISQCIGDGIAIVDANIGVNKVNYFIKNEALLDMTFHDDGILTKTLTVTIHNTSTDQMPGAGPYQSYLRVYFPKGTVISSVSLDGTVVSQRPWGDTALTAIPFYSVEDQSFVVVHIPFVVNQKQQRRLVIETVTQYAFESVFSYQQSIRKQPGVSSFPWHTVIRYPALWQPTEAGGLAKDGVLEYNTDLTTDAHVGIIFRK